MGVSFCHFYAERLDKISPLLIVVNFMNVFKNNGPDFVSFFLSGGPSNSLSSSSEKRLSAASSLMPRSRSCEHLSTFAPASLFVRTAPPAGCSTSH
jgi:hypothetical protein